MKQKSQRVAPTGAPMNHKNKTDSKPGKTLGNMVGTFESTRLVGICNPERSNGILGITLPIRGLYA